MERITIKKIRSDHEVNPLAGWIIEIDEAKPMCFRCWEKNNFCMIRGLLERERKKEEREEN